MQRRLSRHQFRNALRKGLGRAVLHARSFGLRRMEPEITSALRRRLAYDAQCEQGRGRFLWTVIQAAKAESQFRPIVAKELVTGGERDCYVTAQLCELAGRYAAWGDAGIKEALYTLFERSLATRDLLGEKEILDADGLEGYERMARAIGRRTRSRQAVCDYCAEFVFESVRKADRRKARSILRRKDADLAAFKKLLAIQSGRRKRHKLLKPPSWNQVRAEIERGGSRAISFARRYGKVASMADRAAALDYALAQTDPERAAKALSVFQTSRLPRYDPRLRVLATSRNRRLQGRAFAALATLSHPEVRSLALESLRRPRLSTAGGLSLFTKNYRDEDGVRITRAIAMLKSEESSHTAALDLRDVAGRECPRSLALAVIRACIQSPCGLCRSGLFKSLCAARAVPSWMIREFLFDTDEDTRLLASRASKQRQR